MTSLSHLKESIAHMRSCDVRPTISGDAADVLIEIAEAALEWRSTLGRPRGDRAADVAEQRLIRLLDKVLP